MHQAGLTRPPRNRFPCRCLCPAAAADGQGRVVAAKELRAAYEAWCAAQGYEPLSEPKLAAELKALGYDKWKSCGLIRYRDLQLVA